MKRLITMAFLTLLTKMLLAQQLSQQVVNSSGQVFQSNSFSITTNVGEAITATFTSNNNMLTQGFIQPFKFDLPTSLWHLANLDNNFSLFPNPITEGASIEFQDNGLEIKSLEIYSTDGKLVLNQPPTNNYFNLTKLADGLYWVRPIVLGKQFGLKKIIKTH